MLQSLGFLVHPIPGVAERFGEVCFDHPMTAQRAQRGAAPAVSELDAMVTLVGEQALIGKSP